MKKASLFLIVICLFFSSWAQDRLNSVGTNPSLYTPQSKLQENDKLLVAEDSIIYQYDTLSLPFIDDFSKNYLPKRVTDLTSSNVRDTLFYALYQNGVKVHDSVSYSRVPTFSYQIGILGDTITKTPNTFVIVEVFNLDIYPPESADSTYYPNYNIYDTIGGAGPVRIKVLNDKVQDSAYFYIVDKNPNDKYIDRDVLVNQSFPVNPPSFGVATFDGLDEYGLPYSLDYNEQVSADKLTSMPIDLENPSGMDQVYLSFYYQPQGVALDKPEAEDSLALDFYDSKAKLWSNVWRDTGSAVKPFRQIMIKVDSNYHNNAFQFRFRSYAQGSGAYDPWHVDYIYLNDGRNENDTTYKDIAFRDRAEPILSDYWVMPWWHFKSNPALYTISNSTYTTRNLFSSNLNIFFKLNLLDTIGNPPFYSFPNGNLFINTDAETNLDLNFNVNHTYKEQDVKGPGKLEAIYTIDFQPSSTATKDFIRSNDTLKTGVCLDNYYAYDDGSAEAAYGVNPPLGSDGYVSYMAVQYQIPFKDTIGGVQIYFLPQFPDIRKQTFEIFIWDNLVPSTIAYQQTETQNPLYTEDNGFVTYWLDSLVVVNQGFYIGIKSVGQFSMGVGYDLNTANKDRIFYGFDGLNWSSPSSGIKEGSLMIRPVFRKKNWGVGIKEQKSNEDDFQLYPNPVKEVLNLKFSEAFQNAEMELYTIHGSLISRSKLKSQLNTSDLNDGVYLIRILKSDGTITNKKFVKSN
jgi:hypothetical protein